MHAFLPAATEAAPTVAIAAVLERGGAARPETLAVSVVVVEPATAALSGVTPLVANTGVASGRVVVTLAVSLGEGGNEDDEETGSGGDTHLENYKGGAQKDK